MRSPTSGRVVLLERKNCSWFGDTCAVQWRAVRTHWLETSVPLQLLTGLGLRMRMRPFANDSF